LHTKQISEIEIACKIVMKWEKHTCKVQESIEELFDCKITTNYFVNNNDLTLSANVPWNDIYVGDTAHGTFLQSTHLFFWNHVR